MSLPKKTHTLKVLDHGYVRLVDVMGSDLTVVNAARVSYDKESFQFSEKDRRLLHFLATHGHTSPFRHATLQWEIYAPLMVARQWWKYIVGSIHQDPMTAWNESSRRYVTEEPVFHVPEFYQWRSAPKHSKQGSGENLPPDVGLLLTEELRHFQRHALRLYDLALAKGVAPEQARLFLPAYGLYVRWYWTCSLQACVHFLQQRLADDAQWEIRQYAQAVYQLARPYFENSFAELLEVGKGGEEGGE